MLCVLLKVVEVCFEEGSKDVSTKYHLLQIKPSLGEDTAHPITSTDSANDNQQAKRVEVKKEGRKSQERSRPSCEGTWSTPGPEVSQKRRPLFVTAGHMVTLNPKKLTDFAGTPLSGTMVNVSVRKLRVC